MKREIKFRVWAKAFKPPRFIKLDEMQCFNGQTWGDIFRKTDDSLFEFQQYTGLRDKHNREIYEGDIVGQLNWKNQVIFENGSFQVNGWSLDVYTDESLGDGKCEIIGNVFENPDLIK